MLWNKTAGRDKLIDSLVTMVPSLIGAEVVLQTACLRPLATDGLPIIGEVPDWNGVYLATGHWTLGNRIDIRQCYINSNRAIFCFPL